jgi:hypothetical protein
VTYSEKIRMDRPWARAKYPELYEKSLKKSFVYHIVDDGGNDERKKKWPPESVSPPDHIGDDHGECDEHKRDIAHEHRESIEKCPI